MSHPETTHLTYIKTCTDIFEQRITLSEFHKRLENNHRVILPEWSFSGMAELARYTISFHPLLVPNMCVLLDNHIPVLGF